MIYKATLTISGWRVGLLSIVKRNLTHRDDYQLFTFNWHCWNMNFTVCHSNNLFHHNKTWKWRFFQSLKTFFINTWITASRENKLILDLKLRLNKFTSNNRSVFYKITPKFFELNLLHPYNSSWINSSWTTGYCD